jgi:Txe/YoeB family toxin of toxin-antitoxin system
LIKRSELTDRVRVLIDVLRRDPLEYPPPYERLRGELVGAYSRRINQHHRLVYEVFPDVRTVRVLRMWTHYE